MITLQKFQRKTIEFFIRFTGIGAASRTRYINISKAKNSKDSLTPFEEFNILFHNPGSNFAYKSLQSKTRWKIFQNLYNALEADMNSTNALLICQTCTISDIEWILNYVESDSEDAFNFLINNKELKCYEILNLLFSSFEEENILVQRILIDKAEKKIKALLEEHVSFTSLSEKDKRIQNLEDDLLLSEQKLYQLKAMTDHQSPLIDDVDRIYELCRKAIYDVVPTDHH